MMGANINLFNITLFLYSEEILFNYLGAIDLLIWDLPTIPKF